MTSAGNMVFVCKKFN